MRNSSYATHYAISRYSIREFNTGAEPFMVAIIIIIIIYYYCYWDELRHLSLFIHPRLLLILVIKASLYIRINQLRMIQGRLLKSNDFHGGIETAVRNRYSYQVQVKIKKNQRWRYQNYILI